MIGRMGHFEEAQDAEAAFHTGFRISGPGSLTSCFGSRGSEQHTTSRSGMVLGLFRLQYSR